MITRGFGGDNLITRGLGSLIEAVVKTVRVVRREVLRLVSEIDRIIRLKS